MAIKFSAKPQSGAVSAKDGKSAPAADAGRQATLTADGATDLFEPDAGKQTARAKARKKK
jgi:hypothetical protein